MNDRNNRSIDFEVLKEPWNKYQLVDNSILKTRTILKKIDRVLKDEKISFVIDAHTLIVIYPDSSLKGIPNPQNITKEDIIKSIDRSDMQYDTLAQEFNEYLLDDGTKIKIFTDVREVSRTTLKDAKGDPVYSVRSSNNIEVKPADQYKHI